MLLRIQTVRFNLSLIGLPIHVRMKSKELSSNHVCHNGFVTTACKGT